MNLRERVIRFIKRPTDPGPLEVIEALFLRLLGLIYLTAFGSLWPQILGLAGSHGVEPSAQVMSAIRSELGAKACWYVPTLLWFGNSDSALVWLCALGCACALFLIGGFFSRSAAAACFVLYLSLVSAGQPFTSFQWDALLLESGFLALFAGAPWLVWAFRFLLFRLMFESGVVKLLSHDPTWRNLHALRFHFMTQPLPNPIAYYLYRAPPWMLDAMTAATLVIELVAPWLLFCPKRLRLFGVALLMFLQLLVLLTGNYAFFNLLALALCLWGLDNSAVSSLAVLLRRRVRPVTSRLPRLALNMALGVLMAIGAIQLIDMFDQGFGGPVRNLLSLTTPFQIVNTYGLFAVMTTTRPEIVIEGSEDRENWKEYSFRYKPGELHRGLPLVAPYQPRLDWQMWFAALGTIQENSWVQGLMYRLLQGNPAVIGLMNPPPFAKPPRFMRALLYEYQFTTFDERTRTGAVWRRKLLGTWFGPVSLKGS